MLVGREPSTRPSQHVPSLRFLKQVGGPCLGVHVGLPSARTPGRLCGPSLEDGHQLRSFRTQHGPTRSSRGPPVCQGASGGDVSALQVPRGLVGCEVLLPGEKVHEGETGAHGCPRWEGLCLQISGQGAWVLMSQASRTLGMAQRPLFGGGCGQAGREKLRYRWKVWKCSRSKKAEHRWGRREARPVSCSSHRRAPWGGFRELAQGHTALSALGPPPPRGR